MPDENVNHVCDRWPCLCGPGEGNAAWEECACIYVGFARCRACGSPMRKVDVSTGKEVLEHCDLEWTMVDEMHVIKRTR